MGVFRSPVGIAKNCNREGSVTPEVGFQLMRLHAEFNAILDRIHDEAIRNFNHLARSTGQRTRVDRL